MQASAASSSRAANRGALAHDLVVHGAPVCHGAGAAPPVAGTQSAPRSLSAVTQPVRRRARRDPDVAPDRPSAGPARIVPRSWPSATPTPTASSTSTTRSSCSSRRSCPPRPPTCGSTRHPALFAPLPGRRGDYAGADRAELEAMIQPTGFFRAKTDALIKLGAALVERYDGEVPRRLEDLVTLPGVGPQDGERRAGQRLRHPGHHRRHPLRPAGPPVRLDRRRPTRSRSSPRSARCSRSRDWTMLSPPPDLPRPPHLPRPQARLRRLPGRAAVPVVRRGRDRPGQGRASC